MGWCSVTVLTGTWIVLLIALSLAPVSVKEYFRTSGSNALGVLAGAAAIPVFRLIARRSNRFVETS